VPGEGAVLVIGGTADVTTLGLLHARAAVAVTAVLVQDTRGVSAVFPLPAALVAQQIRAAVEDIDVGAVKIGLVPSPAMADAILQALDGVVVPIVFDPVWVSSGGQPLAEVQSLVRIAARATLCTPNRQEADALFGPAFPLGRDVLVTGGDGEAASVYDVLHRADGSTRTWKAARVPWGVRGTGCRLSTAIAAGLLRRQALEAAIGAAIRFTRKSIRGAETTGSGRRLFAAG
jgi:hydroxymethylpyrimidine/phosphomethylpyrimidine kinase